MNYCGTNETPWRFLYDSTIRIEETRISELTWMHPNASGKNGIDLYCLRRQRYSQDIKTISSSDVRSTCIWQHLALASVTLSILPWPEVYCLCDFTYSTAYCKWYSELKFSMCHSHVSHFKKKCRISLLLFFILDSTSILIPFCFLIEEALFLWFFM